MLISSEERASLGRKRAVSPETAAAFALARLARCPISTVSGADEAMSRAFLDGRLSATLVRDFQSCALDSLKRK